MKSYAFIVITAASAALAAMTALEVRNIPWEQEGIAPQMSPENSSAAVTP